jgi:hypothetical protein
VSTRVGIRGGQVGILIIDFNRETFSVEKLLRTRCEVAKADKIKFRADTK